MRIAGTPYISSDSSLRLGYVPLTHAAPLLVARAHDLFRLHGLNVRLAREVGWATVREKILSGELDAAQALAPMPLAMTLGLNCARADCLTALVMTLHGNAIVISRELWSQTGGDPAALLTVSEPRSEPWTFAVVYPHSAQSFVLHEWLNEAGLVPERDYRVVVVPPPQMVSHLKAGHIHAFCVGEPWATLAVQMGVGMIAALSADLAPGHPEKVLLVRASFVRDRSEEHLALVRALLQACEFCAQPQNHEEVVELLAHRDGLNLPPDVLQPAITGQFNFGAGRNASRPDSVLFHGREYNEPSRARMRWTAHHVDPTASQEIIDRSYRADLFHAAVGTFRTASLPTSDEAVSCLS